MFGHAQDTVVQYFTPNPGVQKAFTLRCKELSIPPYTLPDPLVLDNGQPVTDSSIWWQQRRPEILSLFENEMYGKTPCFSKATASFLRTPRTKLLNENKHIFNGKATRQEIRLYFTEKDTGFHLDILLYTPNHTKQKVPAYVMLNFRGNQSITDDPEVEICSSWMTPTDDGSVFEFRSTEKSRGVAKSRWPIEKIIDRGYALATACYQQIVPDYDTGVQGELHTFFYRKGQTTPEPNEWGAIGAWAWGMSRILDFITTDPRINPEQVIAAGHSRLGKTALWAGAQDQRFAAVIANNSGCGGGALSKRLFGETIALLCYVRPHWFCKNFNQYANNEPALPFDQHELISLIAPRPVYLATAEDDWAADPNGEQLSLQNAETVYRLLGADSETLGFHKRPGKHDVTKQDWEQFLNFTDKCFHR